MKKLILALSLNLYSFFIFSTAQTVTKVDTINGTPLTITASPKVSELINKMDSNNCKRSTNDSSFSYTDDLDSRRISVPKRKLSTAEICRQNPRVLGYKIQVAVVKSNKEANEIKASFRQKFPHTKTIVDASLRPNYKILAGSYFTKESASGDLKSIKAHFKSAVAVQYYIFCEEGK